MDVGAILDYCITWNELHGIKKEETKGVRKATQADIDAFLG